MRLNLFFVRYFLPAGTTASSLCLASASQSLLRQRIPSGGFYLTPASGSNMRLNRFFVSEFLPAGTTASRPSLASASQSLLRQRIPSGGDQEPPTKPKVKVSIASSSANSFRL